MRKIFCAFEFWCTIIRRPADRERAFFVHERWSAYWNSAINMFIASLILGLFLGINVHGSFILLIMIFGFHIPALMVMTHRETNRYWKYRGADLDEEIRRMSEETERRWRQTQREFEERMRNAQQDANRRRQGEWDNIRREFRNTGNRRQQAPQQAPRPTGIEGYLYVLGLSGTCRDFSAIKKAYRSLAKKYHPDINKAPDAEKRFKEVRGAFEALERVLG